MEWVAEYGDSTFPTIYGFAVLAPFELIIFSQWRALMPSSSMDDFHLFEKIWYCLVFHSAHVTHLAASNGVPFLSVVVVNFGHHIQTKPRMAKFF